MKNKLIFFFLISFKQMIPSSFNRIFKIPKTYFLNLKNDVLTLKCNKLSIMTFVKKHPFFACKALHSTCVALHDVVYPTYFRRYYHLFDSIFLSGMDLKGYTHFFDYLLKFDQAYNNEFNIFSGLFPSIDMNHYQKYLRYPFLTFFVDIYSFFKTKPKQEPKKYLELEELSFIPPQEDSQEEYNL